MRPKLIFRSANKRPASVAIVVAGFLAGLFLVLQTASAETKKGKAPTVPATKQTVEMPPERPAAVPATPVPLSLSAVLGAEPQPISSGLVWRIFAEDAASASLKEITRIEEPAPTIALMPGAYLVHVGLGLGSATRRITLGADGSSERLSLPVGGLSVRGTLNDNPIPAEELSIAVYIPSEVNSEERLVTDALKAGDVLRLPEGTYHVVSTYGASNASVRADIQVRSGKAIDVLMRHRAARITLKLVSKAGGEALANTEWTVLTPGGDVVREELGAFPTVILAEGNYTAIARHDGQTYVEEIKVLSGPARDVEVLATAKAQ